MTHDSYREFIQREMDEDLSPAELELLETHVAICAECRLEREQYKNLALDLARLSKVLPERSFVAQIAPEFQPLPQAERQGKTRRLAPVWYRGLSVAAVVVLAVGWSTQWSFGLHPHKALQQPVALGTAQPAADQSAASADKQSPVAFAPEAQPPTAQSPNTSSTEQQQPRTGSATLQKTTQSASSTLVADSSSSQKSTPPASSTVPAAGGKGSTSGGSGTATGATPGSINKGVHTPSAGGSFLPATQPGDQTAPPAASIIGAAPTLGDTFNEQLQAQVNSGDATVHWAIDPYQVVQHSLTALGFAKTANVMPTNSNERIRVLQGGALFEITLQQPFDHGLNGIWVPVQIGRAINETKPAAYEKPVLDYFNKMTGNGTPLVRQQIFVVSHLTANTLTVNVVEAHTNANGQTNWTNEKYVFTLKQNTNLSWELDGAPVAITTA